MTKLKKNENIRNKWKLSKTSCFLWKKCKKIRKNEEGWKQMKKQYKIDCIADGIERAKMRMNNDRDIYEY